MRRARPLSRRTLLALGLAATGLAASGRAPALAARKPRPYPNRTVTLIVPYAAGGPTDVVGRLVAQSLSATFRKRVIVENVAGAGGTTGAAQAAKAPRDGYTLLLHHVALAVGHSLYPRRTYDTLSAFEPVGLVNTGPFVLLARKSLGITSIADALAHIRTNPRKATFAHAGVGSGAHLCTLMLQSALGLKVTEVAYRGTGPAMNDLVGGQIDFMFDQSVTALPQIGAGTIAGLAVTARRRLDLLPAMPTLQEAGVADYEVTQWHAVYAPAGTPKAALDRIAAALEVALEDPAVGKRFAELGTTVFPKGQRSGVDARAMLTGEVRKWATVMAAAGVTSAN